MPGYGSLSKKASGALGMPQAGIFLENPDGSIAEAVPSHVRDKEEQTRQKTRRSSRQSSADEENEGNGSDISENAAATMYEEVEFLYNQHAKVLFSLLFVHFGLVVLFEAVFLLHLFDGTSVHEFVSMYGIQDLERQRQIVGDVLWVVYAIFAIYHAWFYTTAGMALWTRKPRYYRDLANCGLTGIVGMVFLAYVDKFNLLIFFLHLLVYLYSRFMQGLSASLLLLPPGNTANTVAAP